MQSVALHRLSRCKNCTLGGSASKRERALDGLDFSRVSLGAALLISKADKPSGILKRGGEVATVVLMAMPMVTTSE